MTTPTGVFIGRVCHTLRLPDKLTMPLRWRRMRVMTDSWVIAAMMRREPRRHNGQVAMLFRSSILRAYDLPSRV